MTNYYFSASSYDSLAGMLTTIQNGHIALAYQNVLGPAQGRSALAASTDTKGSIVPAVAAAGDPALWYVGIKSDAAITAPTGVSVCDAETGEAVLGIWA